MVSKQTLFDNTPVKAEFELPQRNLPASARVVIVGGGIAGASLAYHFGQAGWDNVVLLEQNQLASGTTWHSAGQVGQLRSTAAQTKVNKASADLYARLEHETGHDPGWLQCGGLQLARCEERRYQLQRQTSMAELFGVQAEMVDANHVQRLWPTARTNDLLAATYLPGDGRVLPGECTIALAKGAMDKGVAIHDQVRVEKLLCDESPAGTKEFRGVRTNRGEIQCEWIVIAGNMWMRPLGLSVGVDIPVYPCEHHYLITQPADGVTRMAPCTRDPDAGIYFRALDDGSMKLGAFKKRAKPWQIGDCVPHDFAFGLLDPDWPDFAEPFQEFQHRLPWLERDHIVKFVSGPEAFTPDNNFIIGEPFLTKGLFVMGGWNSAGIACSGGAGKYAVEWIENGGMTIDLTAVDILRFLPFQNQQDYLQQRVSEVLGLHYRMAWPNRQMETARGEQHTRSSPIYSTHQEHNAEFGNTAGWERPLYFAPTSVDPGLKYTFLRPNWQEWVSQEVLACRQNVAVMDQSTFAKYVVEGPEALSTLQWLCGRNINVPIGRAVYTGMFNERGTFESDLTVVRTGTDSFYVITATAQENKDFDWIARHLPANGATLANITEQISVVSVMGPHADALLQSIPFGAPKNPRYGAVHETEINGIPVRAIRISYVGEPGWELHVSAELADELYLAILELGQDVGIRPVGNLAISAMRIEKGFRAYGHELSPDENPFEAGLDWCLDWKKDFLGKSALSKLRDTRPQKRLVCFALRESDIVLWGKEPILLNGEKVGYTSSACYSPVLGSSIAMGYVPTPILHSQENLDNSGIEIEHLETRYPVVASLKSPIDAHQKLQLMSTKPD